MPTTRREALRQQADVDVTATPPDEGESTGAGSPGPAHERATAAGTRPTQSPALPLPTEQFLTTLIETITRVQAETNRTLINSLMSGADFRASTPVMPNPAASTTSANGAASSGNFTRCTARFHGTNDAEVLEAFLDAVEVYKECAAVSDEHALRGLPMLLEGEAAVWWRGVKATATTWQDALVRLRHMYGSTQPGYKTFRQIFAAEQRDDERAEVFLCKLRALIAKLPYELDEIVQTDICYGLLNRKIKKRVSRECIVNLDMLLRDARIAEDSIKEFMQVNNSNNNSQIRSQTKSLTIGHNLTRSESPTTSATNIPNKKLNSKIPHDGNSSVNSNSQTINPSKIIRCYGCGKRGVVRSKCNVCNTMSTSILPSTPSSKEEKGASFNSAVINLPDSIEIVASSRDNLSDDVITSLYANCNSRRVNVHEDASHPMVNVCIMGHDGVAIVDTGATHCIASPMLYRLLVGSGVTFRETQRLVRLADGSQAQHALLVAEVPIAIEGREVSCEFLVLPGGETRTLLGVEFLSRVGMLLDVAQGKWMFADDPEHSYDFVQSYTLRPTDAELMRVETEDLSLRDDEGLQLTSEQRCALNEFIDRRAAQFAVQGPPTEFATHRIKVSPDLEPIASPPYRMSQGKREALEKELDKLLRDDVIEECESPWASNVVLVAKKDGSLRLCIDYRKLNAVTEPDRYPLPRIEDILHAAKTSEFMSTLDLRSGYHQVNVCPEDRDKTAFISPLGTYRFKRMPMGLRNSGATFQRLMDRFRSNLKGVELLAYLDDLIILSPGPFENHLADLNAVFDRLAMFNLRVHRGKSHFARDSVKFLGHVIVPGGIQLDSDKTAAVDNMAVPQNIKHLKCFLQTSSWFRRFIPNYAEVARPLTTLLKKASVWRWGSEQQKAFEHIKSLLVSAPILRQAEESKPFVLCTDSSAYCLGAVLMQGEGPDERPIEYASRLLTGAERNYSTTEREALAVVWALGKFRGYVENAKVVVRTDHQPLRWLMNQRSPSGRLARWALTLQDFDLSVEYTPGRSNVVADTLSRPVCPQDPDCDVRLTVIDMPKRNSSDIRENQLRDPEVRKIVEDLESDEPSRGRPWSDRGYTISDGILYRYSLESDDGEDSCLVVPEHERKQVMADLHDAPTAGHFGVERTLSRVRSRYYWPGMRTFVTNYVRDCVPCQRYKADNRKPAGLLQTPAVARRFEVVSVDLFGPLVETPRKNRWILVVEDVCSRWVELFPLESATSAECAQTLVNEVFLRYGVPRRLISDNGVQFVSEVMQQVCHVLGISQALTPFYHPEANPIERKNRDLKPQLAILVGQDHSTWDLHLAAVRFAMNSAVTASTGFSPAYLTFGRELRAPSDSATDMRAILEKDNFVPSITPYLRRIAETLDEARDTHEKAQGVQKRNADKTRRTPPDCQVGDLVLLKTQGPNDAGRGQSAKFIPRRDGPYKIGTIVSPTTYELENVQTGASVGKYHISHLKPFSGPVEPPLREKRKRGRPRRYIDD